MTVIPRQVSVEHELNEWIARCREGDEAAFRVLHDAHFAQVHRTARALGTPPSELDDVLQEVFASAFSRLAQFHGGDFGHWLHRICANVVTDRHRRRRVRETFRRLFGASLQEEADPAAAPDRSTEQAEARAQVAAILARLRPRQREVFALYELEGLSGEEIAARVGCPVNTVWTRLHHARRAFLKIGRQRGWIEHPGEAP